MRVKMKTIYASPRGNASPGQFIELAAKEGLALVAGGFAELDATEATEATQATEATEPTSRTANEATTPPPASTGPAESGPPEAAAAAEPGNQEQDRKTARRRGRK